LYQQLREVPGQILISTHSPYLAGIANIEELRFLSKITNNVSAKKIRTEFEDHDDLRKIQREVVHSRGELLFSKAIVLSEGETEEQALPALFEAYMGVSPFIVGINFVGVGGSGSKYRPFLTLAKDLEIPVFIFSDGEPATVKALESNYKKVFGETENLGNYLTVLDGTDFEGYLLDNGYQPQIEAAITEELGPDSIEHWIKKKNGTPLRPTRSDKPPCPTCRQSIFEAELRDYSGDDGRKRALLDIIQSQKPTFAKSVSSQLAKLEKQWLPPKVIEFFEKIKVALK
jgi:putative ATP-dependent endonuclease of OLD family